MMATLGYCGPCSSYVVNSHDAPSPATCPQCRQPIPTTTDTAELVGIAREAGETR